MPSRFDEFPSPTHRVPDHTTVQTLRCALGSAAVVLMWLWAFSVQAQIAASEVPEDLQGAELEQKLDAQVPMELTFVDETGKAVTLGEYFQTDRPVILNLGYYGCPHLCGLVSNALIDALRQVDLKVGEDFSVLSVSIDPTETPALAAEKRKNQLEALGQEGAGKGWHMLTGERDAIAALTQTVGFNFRWVTSQEQYIHPAVLILLTPDGRVARYLHGINVPSRTLRLSLVEASERKIGTFMDGLFLSCLQYSDGEGQYAMTAMTLMRIGAALTILLLFGGIGIALLREMLRRSGQPNVLGAGGGA